MWSPLPGSVAAVAGDAVAAAPREGLLTSPASLTFELLSSSQLEDISGVCRQGSSSAESYQ